MRQAPRTLSALITSAGANPKAKAGNTKGGSITVLLTSCLTGLD